MANNPLVAEGKVAWVYRHFPLDGLHRNARREAHATECAAELGGNEGFWDFINSVYEITESNDGLDLSILPDIAEEVGIDREKFIECQSSDRHADIIKFHEEDAVTSGGTGTPHTVLLTSSGETFTLPGLVEEPTLNILAEVIVAGVEEGLSYEEMVLNLQTEFQKAQEEGRL